MNTYSGITVDYQLLHMGLQSEKTCKKTDE